MHKIVVGIGGASGSIYAKRLLDKLAQLENQWEAIGVVVSENAKVNWELELGKFDPSQYPFDFYTGQDFNAPFASGSARYQTMIICPCSMGLVGRIANGISNDLISRAADVILKERRRLILVPRETPLSLIHLNNLKLVTETGAIVCPASPSFYSKPQSVEEMVDTVIDRLLDLSGFTLVTHRWNDG